MNQLKHTGINTRKKNRHTQMFLHYHRRCIIIFKHYLRTFCMYVHKKFFTKAGQLILCASCMLRILQRSMQEDCILLHCWSWPVEQHSISSPCLGANNHNLTVANTLTKKNDRNLITSSVYTLKLS